AFELHYPHMVERMRDEAHVGLGHGKDKAESPQPRNSPKRGPDDGRRNMSRNGCSTRRPRSGPSRAGCWRRCSPWRSRWPPRSWCRSLSPSS
ncbi:hypothetical protein GS498_18780, partial [Rhodococcus hoagii]|nr:hypothetical protein [Prescottella equi]